VLGALRERRDEVAAPFVGVALPKTFAMVECFDGLR